MSRPRAKRSPKFRRCQGLKLVRIGAFRRCCRVSDEKSTEKTLDQIPPHILCWMTDGMVIKPILFNCIDILGGYFKVDRIFWAFFDPSLLRSDST